MRGENELANVFKSQAIIIASWYVYNIIHFQASAAAAASSSTRRRTRTRRRKRIAMVRIKILELQTHGRFSTRWQQNLFNAFALLPARPYTNNNNLLNSDPNHSYIYLYCSTSIILYHVKFFQFTFLSI